MTNPNPSPELLPCPSGHTKTSRNNNNIYGAWWVQCADGECSWRTAGDTEAEAIAAWNTRASLSQTPPPPSLSTDVQSAATGFHEHDVSLKVAMPGVGEVEARFWLIVHEPGKVPDRKGSWPRSQLPQIMREFIGARPNAYLTVLTIGADGLPDVQHGPEALQMADSRSMRTGSAHNARTLAAHTEALATVAAGDDEGVASDTVAFVQDWLANADYDPTQFDKGFASAIDARVAAGIEAAAKVAESRWSVWADKAYTDTPQGDRAACADVAAAIRLLSQGEGEVMSDPAYDLPHPPLWALDEAARKAGFEDWFAVPALLQTPINRHIIVNARALATSRSQHEGASS
jgi:hypothetical protein